MARLSRISSDPHCASCLICVRIISIRPMVSFHLFYFVADIGPCRLSGTEILSFLCLFVLTSDYVAYYVQVVYKSRLNIDQATY